MSQDFPNVQFYGLRFATPTRQGPYMKKENLLNIFANDQNQMAVVNSFHIDYYTPTDVAYDLSSGLLFCSITWTLGIISSLLSKHLRPGSV